MLVVKVTARLANGYGTYDPWAPALEALASYAYLKETLPPEVFTNTGDQQKLLDADIPIYRVPYAPGDFFYAVSLPLPEVAGSHTKYFHKRFDAVYADYYARLERKTVVNTRTGAYKSFRVPLRLVVTPAVSWYVVVADRAAVKELLRLLTTHIKYIGKRHTHGNGMVLDWSWEPVSARLAHMWACRALPVSYVDATTPKVKKRPWMASLVREQGWGRADIGVRPPLWHPARTRACYIPTQEAISYWLGQPVAGEGGVWP